MSSPITSLLLILPACGAWVSGFLCAALSIPEAGIAVSGFSERVGWASLHILTLVSLRTFT